MTHYRLTLISSNTKTGPIPVSTTSSETCWIGCGLYENCYGKGGPLAIVWRQTDSGRFATDLPTFCSKIALFADGQLWRHDQAGDLPGEGEVIDYDSLMAIVAANFGRRGFTYTHKPVLKGYRVDDTIVAANRKAIAEANAGGFTVNLSADNLSQADAKAALGIAPVTAVVASEYGRKTDRTGEWAESLADYRERVRPLAKTTPEGRKARVCIATYLDTDCARCGWCQDQERDWMVLFPAHGSRAAGADRVAREA